MGLIKAAGSAISSTMQNQFLNAITCDDMENDILMVRKTTSNGVIPKGSRIIVKPGQVAAIYNMGRVVDATAEEGVYTFDESSSPSFFAGQFGAVFGEMWERFKFGGAVAKDQAVFFFNVKEIFDNKFGTPNPVPYKDWGHPLINPRTNQYSPMRVEIKCFGKYTFRINNPALFMSQVAGTADVYTKAMLVEQMRAEVIGSFSNVMNSLGEDEYKIEALSLPNKTDEIKKIMDENVFDEAIRARGVMLVSFIIESLTLDDESKKKMDAYEMGGDAYQQKGVLTGAYAEAVKGAATNDNGAMSGFMGVGMMNMAGGNVFGGVANTVNQEQPQQPLNNNLAPTPKPENVEVSPDNGEINTDSKLETDTQKPKFCSECGSKLSDDDKFCKECGKKI